MRKVKLLCVITILFCSVLLCGCRALRPHKFSQSIDQIIKIEFIMIEEEGRRGPYDDCPTILVIEPEQYDQLFSDYYELIWWASNPPPTYMRGVNLKITYANQEYELIGMNGYYLSEEGGSLHPVCNIRDDDWDEFLAKYDIPPYVFPRTDTKE